MVRKSSATHWLSHPLKANVAKRLDRMKTAPGCKALVVMPDIHLTPKACNGIALATTGTLFPDAVGGDIGCGYLMADVQGSVQDVDGAPQELLRKIGLAVPILRCNAAQLRDISTDLLSSDLSDARLNKMKYRNAKIQLGTLGRGNHFVELQRSDAGLHLLIHSGSRSMGPAILNHHLRRCEYDQRSQLYYLKSDSGSGQNYLNDVDWARRYAAENRRCMLDRIAVELKAFGWTIDFSTVIDRDHNHVQLELHGDQYWVHRKGTQRLSAGEIGIIPGSMATASFLVSGRGHIPSLDSCSHGAGRQLSRKQAAQQISARDVKRQLRQIHFDVRRSRQICEEAPAAYKDIRKVLQAQKELVRIEQQRVPLLNYRS